ncbi:MAG: hypothetical protein QNJ13_04580 [Paracoccaceae bacterium]|nr:hypothetical protein [Paracoccaceae bacterium]
MADLLRRLAGELAALSWRAERIQEVTGTIAEQAETGATALRYLQDLDLITQSLADLSQVTRVLSDAAPVGAIDAGTVAERLVLDDLRRRLTEPDGARRPPTSNGSVAFF